MKITSTKNVLLCAGIMLFFCGNCLSAQNTVAELRKQINTMAKELESQDAKDLRKFILTYATSEDVKKFTRDGKIDQIVKGFTGKKSQSLKKVLESVLKLEPKISKENSYYSFEVDKSSGSGRAKLDFIYDKKAKIFHLKN